MIVLTGESGSGKSTVEKELRKRGFNKIISYTTREPRIKDGEIDGVDYHFVSKDTYFDMLDSGKFAENVEYNGNYYSIAKEDCLDDTIVVVEPNGLKQLKQCNDINVKAFYLKVPRDIRESRMISRGDSLESVKRRLELDDEHFKEVEELCDYTITSLTLDETVNQILKVMGGNKQ